MLSTDYRTSIFRAVGYKLNTHNFSTFFKSFFIAISSDTSITYFRVLGNMKFKWELYISIALRLKPLNRICSTSHPRSRSLLEGIPSFGYAAVIRLVARKRPVEIFGTSLWKNIQTSNWRRHPIVRQRSSASLENAPQSARQVLSRPLGRLFDIGPFIVSVLIFGDRQR
jgi:hypothetical protein